MEVDKEYNHLAYFLFYNYLKGSDIMGIPKGTKRRNWSYEEKKRIVLRYLNEDLGIRRLAKQENMDHSLLNHWVHKYLDNGEDGLKPKGHPGNSFAALGTSKNLSEIDRLRLMVAKQDIEIKRLKKGYQVKGAGVNKEYVITNDVNLKS